MQSRNSQFVAQSGNSYLAQDNSGIASAQSENNLMLVRLTKICLHLLFDMLIFVLVILTKKKRKISIITFQTVSGNALFRENRPLHYVNGHGIDSCIVPNPFELCLCLFS